MTQLALEHNQVYTFKMNSGEEMVAKVKHSGSDWIVLEEPVSIAPGPQGMGLVPSLFTADPKEEIRLNLVSCPNMLAGSWPHQHCCILPVIL